MSALQPTSRSSSQPEHGLRGSARSLRVLYVDDDRVNSLLFSETCRVAGNVELEIADTGAEAQELVQHWRPDMLVIDLHLPDTDGYALLPVLRELLRRPELPAFLCTADAERDVARPAEEAGFSGCWSKPLAVDSLKQALSEVARAGRAAA